MILLPEDLLLLRPKLPERHIKAADLILCPAPRILLPVNHFQEILRIRQHLASPRGSVLRIADELQNLPLRRLRKIKLHPVHNFLQGILRLLTVCRRHKLPAEYVLRRRQNRDGPSIGLALFILSLPEIHANEIGLHLKAGQSTLEIFLSALSKSGARFHLAGEELAVFIFLKEEVHNLFLPDARQLIVPARVKVVAVPPIIRKDRQPFPGNEPRPVIEEFPIGHSSTPRDHGPPLPRILRRITRPPVLRDSMLLHGK